MLPNSPTLALINACLNASSALCLVLALVAIRKKKIRIHRNWMLGALAFSTVFLISYLTRYSVYGDTPFDKEGPIRYFYFALLISHIICAIVTVPLVLRTFYLALRSDFIHHRKWARITFPIWAYVSITGVMVYMMLYQL